MNDLISRQEAIESVNELRKSSWYNKVPNIIRNEAVDIVEKFCIKDLPSAQQWIPCSERLPEESGSYIVSGKWASGKVAVGDCEYSKDDGYFRTAWNFDVIAWMPLPEPYKGEEP